jgi:anti-sigma B factor antagonist
MRIEETACGPARVLRATGTLDQAASEPLHEALLAAVAHAGAGAPFVLVEMSKVPFISSAGLRALMLGAKATRAAGGMLAVASLTDDVAEIFRIARFDLVVRVFEGPRDALAAMSPEAAAAWDGR